jgi:two-component system, cell cycle sensor histidine kinase and response regulator CckA
MKSLVCHQETDRLEALHQYQILDTEPEQVFDDLVFLAAQICDAPIALINFIDADRQWFKAQLGLNFRQIPRAIGFCPLCLETEPPQVILIPDTLADGRFATSQVVTSKPYIRFYLGVPLLTPAKQAIGTICVADYVPRQVSQQQIAALQNLSRIIMRQLEIRRDMKQDDKQTQPSLPPREHSISRFLESAPMMMGIVELVDDDILHICDNSAAAQFFGLTPAAMQNRLEREMGIADKHVNQWLHYYRQAERTQSAVQFEYAYTHPQGQKWLLVKISVIIGGVGERSQFAYVMEDISEYKQAAQQICQQSKLIKQLENQLLRTQRLESIGTMASGIAHDLNNLLSPILMSVQILKKKYDDQYITQILDIIEGNAKRSTSLVKQVLSFAQGVTGKHTIIQVQHLISDMLLIIQHTFPQAIAVCVEIQPDLWPVYGDSTQLHQVLMNLCFNARDAMPKGGNLHISAQNINLDAEYAKMHIEARVGAYIIVSVTDTGFGISSAILDKIFEPFFTTKEFGQGTGLGLSTVMAIVKEHGGFITVSTHLEQGTTFQIYLPAVNPPRP